LTIGIDDLVIQVKQVNRIEDIVGDEPGYSISGHGRYMTTREHDSLIVDTHNQSYWWNSTGEHGDVIEWLCKRKGWDFKAAVEYLCKRGGLQSPDWRKQDPTVRMAARQREDVLSVVCDLSHKWLLANPAAVEYCHGRGWTDETIKRTRLGYTGNRDQQEQYQKDLINSLGGAGIDIHSPAAVAVLGFKGNVQTWCLDYGVSPRKEWLDSDKIYGVIGWDRLVYFHFFGGRCIYFSLRGMQEREHFNPPVELMGERQIYVNPRWSSAESMCVIVEGKADAITLDQWDIPAAALNGVAADDRVARLLGATKENKRAIFYLGLDADKAGNLASSKVASLLGPMTRIVDWKDITEKIFLALKSDLNEISIKDTNDVLKASITKGLDQGDFQRELGFCLNTSRTYVETVSEWAGKQEGAERDNAIRLSLNVIAAMSEMERAQYQKVLAKNLQIDQRELSRMVKTIQDMAKKKDNDGDAVVFTVGGFINGWVVELLYNREKHTTQLAWRDPNGNVSSGDSVVIDGIKYKPEPAEETFRERGILFPSELGKLKKAGELASMIELYLNSVYILPNELTTKIISYWVLVTWLYDCFNALPYLRAIGSSGAGKSELLYRVGLVSYRLLMAGGADTVSTLFRSVEHFRPTVLFDEGDIEKSDAANEVVKFFNFGAMKGHPIWRADEVIDQDGKKTYRSKMYPTYCPKMIGMRHDFKDDAVGNRCITFKIQERGMRELMARNISLVVDEEIHQRAQGIRNLMIRWRLQHWQPEIKINRDYYEMDISARLNQITGALMMVAQDDESLRNEIKGFMREYYLEMTQNKSMTIIARVIEAIIKIYKFPDTHKQMVVTEEEGSEKILIGHVTKIANEIIEQMNSTVDEDHPSNDQEQKLNKRDLSPHRIGRLIRDDMQLRVSRRTNKGFFVYYDETRINELARQYGIDPDELGPQAIKPAVEQMEIPS
jgi:DNA primase